MAIVIVNEIPSTHCKNPYSIDSCQGIHTASIPKSKNGIAFKILATMLSLVSGMVSKARIVLTKFAAAVSSPAVNIKQIKNIIQPMPITIGVIQ